MLTRVKRRFEPLPVVQEYHARSTVRSAGLPAWVGQSSSCYKCGTQLWDDTGVMREIIMDTLLQVMHADPLAGIVWGHWIVEGKAKLAPSPLLEKYLAAHEKGL